MPVGQNSELNAVGATPEGYQVIGFNSIQIDDHVIISFTRNGVEYSWEGDIINTGYASGSRSIRVVNIEGHGTVFSNEAPTVYRKN